MSNRSLRRNRRGIELAINTLVTLILGILLFTLSIYLIYYVRDKGAELTEAIDAKTQEEIQRLLTSENAIVALPFASKTVEKGQFADFGLGVRNIGQTATFAYELSFDIATTADGKSVIAQRDTEGPYINRNWLGAADPGGKYVEIGEIAARDSAAVPLSIRPSAMMDQGVTTQPGVYLFTLCIYSAENAPGAPGTCSISTPPDLLYTGKMYSVRVVVK